MQFDLLRSDSRCELESLFRATFSTTEGDQEGKLIGDLAAKLAASIDNTDVFCYGATQGKSIAGAVFLTRLRFDDDALVYMLAPVAVSTAHQRAGTGSSLIDFALNSIGKVGAEVVVTYGDPAYYSKLGFKPLSETVLSAPMELSMPFGWLGQSLTSKPIQTQYGKPSCVEAFRDPAYW